MCTLFRFFSVFFDITNEMKMFFSSVSDIIRMLKPVMISVVTIPIHIQDTLTIGSTGNTMSEQQSHVDC